jgi:hypothetical protein
VAKGDLSKKIDVDVKGEFLTLKNTINHDGGPAAFLCVRSDAGGARGGTVRSLGGQARVEGVSGTWKDLTDSVKLDGGQPDFSGCATSPT